MQSIAVINQKGGVGKTTTTANLAHAVALQGRNVAVVDFDPQSHLSAHLGFTEQNLPGVGDILMDGIREHDVVLQARERLKLIPAGKKLKQVEAGSYQSDMKNNLKQTLNSLLDGQDFVFFDCPPASGTLIQYALGIVDEVLVPVAGDYLALRGLSDLIAALRDYETERDRSFRQRIVVTRFHSRRRLCWEVRDKLVEYFPDQVLATPIRETSVLAESPSFGKTAFEYKHGNNGQQDYASLADDLIKKRCL